MLTEGSVGSMPVVVVQVLDEDRMEVSDAVHEHPVEALPAQGPHNALADGVGLGRRDGRADDLDTLRGEDGVEAVGELRVAVADQEPEPRELLADLPGALGDPGSAWVGVMPARWTRRVSCSMKMRT